MATPIQFTFSGAGGVPQSVFGVEENGVVRPAGTTPGFVGQSSEAEAIANGQFLGDTVVNGVRQPAQVQTRAVAANPFAGGQGQATFDANGQPVRTAPATNAIPPSGATPSTPSGATLPPAPVGTNAAFSFTTPAPQASAPTVNLQRGDTGAQVQQLQNFLVSKGLLTQADVATGPGIFGPKTEAAVIALQKQLGVDNSTGPGIFGPRTRAAIAAGATTAIAPPVAPIGSTVSAPTASGSPSLPTGSGAQDASAYLTGATATLATQSQSLSDNFVQQQQQFQAQIDALTKQESDLRQLEEAGLKSEGSFVAQEAADKRAALQQEQQEFNDAYNAKQGIIQQMNDLAQQGQATLAQLTGMTGLRSILSPRISATTASITGQMGLLKAVLSAQDGQIGAAQRQLSGAVSAISSLYKDQMDYYKSIVSFYDTQAKNANTNITTLSRAEKAFIDAQIKVNEDSIKNAENMQAQILRGLSNPKTALIFAKASVSATDTPDEANAKIAAVIQAQGGVSKNTGTAINTLKQDIADAEQALTFGVPGTSFAGRGSDGYVDPNLYTSIFNNLDDAGKIAFLNKFPPSKNINPENIGKGILPSSVENQLIKGQTDNPKTNLGIKKSIQDAKDNGFTRAQVEQSIKDTNKIDSIPANIKAIVDDVFGKKKNFFGF